MKNQLYFSSPKDFNDPFDCRISKNYLLLNTAEKVNKFVTEAVIRQYNKLVKGGYNIEDIRKSMINRFTNNREEEQKDFEKRHFENQDKYYGVLSLSESWDNILMWTHYSNNHKGFCAGFYKKKLTDLAEIENFKAGPVRYKKTFPKIDPLDNDRIKNGFLETHIKAVDWRYEKEYRLFKLFYPNEPTKDDRIFTVDNSIFAEVTLGKFFPENQIGTMIKIADEKKIPLFRIEKVPYKFKFVRTKLN